MIAFLDEALLSFRSCFSRNYAFNWFVIAIMGFIVRGDSLGITSIIRELNLDPKVYVTFLHFFRSSAWDIETLTRQWIKLVIKFVKLQKVDVLNILIGDGVKQSKEGCNIVSSPFNLDCHKQIKLDYVSQSNKWPTAKKRVGTQRYRLCQRV